MAVKLPKPPRSKPVKVPKPMSKHMISKACKEIDDWANGDTYTLEALNSIFVDSMWDLKEISEDEVIALYDDLHKKAGNRSAVVILTKRH